MNEIPRNSWKPMSVVHFAEQVHETDPHKAGVKHSIYSTPYTRSAEELRQFFVETFELQKYLKLKNDDELMRERYYYIACHATELWPWIHDDDIVSVIGRAGYMLQRHYMGPVRRVLYWLRRQRRRYADA